MPVQPKTLLDYINIPAGFEQQRQALMEQANLQKMIEQKQGVRQFQQMLAPQAGAPGEAPRPSPFVDQYGQVNVAAMTQAPEWQVFAQKHPELAQGIMSGAGMFGTAKAPNLTTEGVLTQELVDKFSKQFPEQASQIKLGLGKNVLMEVDPKGRLVKFEEKKPVGSTTELPLDKRWVDNKTKQYVASGMPFDKAEMKAIEDYNRQVKPAATIAQFEYKERKTMGDLKSEFQGPDGKITEAGEIQFADAMTKGEAPDIFANRIQSSRGVAGAEAKHYIRQQYINFLKEKMPNLKTTQIGNFLAKRAQGYKSNLTSLTAAQKFATLNNRALEQAIRMNDILKGEADTLTTSGIKPQAAMNAWTKGNMNDPKFGRFVVALNSYLSEYMKVVSGGALSVSELSEGAREKGKEMLSTSDSFESLVAKLGLMRTEMEGVQTSWDNAVRDTYGAPSLDISQAPGIRPAPAPSPAPAPAAGGISVDDFNKMK